MKRRKQKGTAIVIPSKAKFGSIIDELRNGHRSTGEAADFSEFLGYSGCRKQEAATTLLKDIKWDAEILMITGGEVGTKNHEPRAIPLFSPLKDC